MPFFGSGGRRFGSEIGGHGLVVAHAVLLDDEARLDVRIEQADMQQRPCRKDGDGRSAAAEHGVSMVDVGCERCGEKNALWAGSPDFHGHRLRQRDVGVEVVL